MIDYVKLALSRYAEFSGRSRRSEYWYWTLAVVIISFLLGIIDGIIGIQIFGTIFALATFVPGLAVSIRRLHDTGRSGWWLLIALVPLVGFILLIVWLASDSAPGPNQYGPNPKSQGDGFQGGGYAPPPGQQWGQAPAQPQYDQGPNSPQWGQPQPQQGVPQQTPQWGQQPPQPGGDQQPQWGQQPPPPGGGQQPQWGQPPQQPAPQWGQQPGQGYPPPPGS